MFTGRYAYLLTDLIFAGIPAILLLIFYYHVIKNHLKDMVKLILIFIICAPIFEQTGFAWNTWQLSPDRYLGFDIFGSSFETYLFTILVTICISSAVYIWTYYRDKKEKLSTNWLLDLTKGNHAIWRKNKD